MSLEYTTRRIFMEPINRDPFAHVVVPDFFEEQTYHKIMKQFPQYEQMHMIDTSSRQVDLIPDRTVANSSCGHWYYENSLKVPQVNFWQKFTKTFCNKPFMNDLLDVFKNDYSIPGNKDMDLYLACKLCIQTKGATDGPRLARSDTVLTVVYYLDFNPQVYGTALCRVKISDTGVCSNKPLEMKDVHVAKEIEYTPNKAVIWPSSNSSFHSFQQQVPATRRTIVFSIIDANTEIKEDLDEIESDPVLQDPVTDVLSGG